MNASELEVRGRIATLMESIKGDRDRSQELFQYVWTMICVRHGLLRIEREVRLRNRTQLVLEEVRTGQQRLVWRPEDLDRDIEGLAVEALAAILGGIKLAS